MTNDFCQDHILLQISLIDIPHITKKEFYIERCFQELFLIKFAFSADPIWTWIYWEEVTIIIFH